MRVRTGVLVLGLGLGTSLGSNYSYSATHWSIDCNTIGAECAPKLKSQASATDRLAEHLGTFFSSATGWSATNSGSPQTIGALVRKAIQTIQDKQRTQFDAKRIVGDDQSSTIRLGQNFKGLEVVGQEAMVHFGSDGSVVATTERPLEVEVSTTPKLSADQALKLLADRYQQAVTLSEPAKLKIFRDFAGKTHLAYNMKTRTTPTHNGQELYVDAHDGAVVLEFDRAYHAHEKGQRTVYNAATEAALEPGRVDPRGYPADINVAWYEKVAEDGKYTDNLDRSALNAYRNSGKVYDYYKSNFGRKSFDDKDTRIVSIVHLGVGMNNAFWTDEYQVMGYGDGDGQMFVDLTYGLDVAAHEITHGVTTATANLVYAAEPGALNEAYSDFFGKMVDFNEDDWLIGTRVMAPSANRRALRNMENPEEFGQPGVNDSPLRRPTNVTCTRGNDRCGVHANSGIPNRAFSLLVKGLGKEKAEQLAYRVLTRHLSATSGFADMRRETIKACGLMYGVDSGDCATVQTVFDTVKM